MSKIHPVIIIGISRSGTTLLTELLEESGLFLGKIKPRHNEALFFQQLNRWLVLQCSGGLENPSSIRYLLDDKETRTQFNNFVRFILRTHRSISYLGFKNYIRLRGIENIDFPWGWKDPLNTYTLPFWLDLFPEAKVIHIKRHPLDVIRSLMIRREKGLARLKSRYSNIKSLYYYFLMIKFVPKPKMFIDMRVNSIESGFQMWIEYMNEAKKNIFNLGDRCLEIGYEDLITNTLEVMDITNKFCSLNNAKSSNTTKINIRKDSLFAYLKVPEYIEFEKQVSKQLKEYGY